VLGEKFPAVFGRNTLETTLKNKVYGVLFITGRPESQRATTLGTLNIQGYTAPAPPAAAWTACA
jgi:hypothetical protein